MSHHVPERGGPDTFHWVRRPQSATGATALCGYVFAGRPDFSAGPLPICNTELDEVCRLCDVLADFIRDGLPGPRLNPSDEGTPMPDTTDLAAPTVAFTAGDAIATSRGVTFPAVTVDRSGTGRVMVTLYDPTAGDSDQDAIVEFDLDHEQALQLASALRVGPTTGHRLDAVTGLGEPVQLTLSSTGTRTTLTATTGDRITPLRGFRDEAQTLARALAAVTKHYAEPATSAEVWLAR